jgi:hypothetical protein
VEKREETKKLEDFYREFTLSGSLVSKKATIDVELTASKECDQRQNRERAASQSLRSVLAQKGTKGTPKQCGNPQ